jgi:hypothetical protein
MIKIVLQIIQHFKLFFVPVRCFASAERVIKRFQINQYQSIVLFYMRERDAKNAQSVISKVNLVTQEEIKCKSLKGKWRSSKLSNKVRSKHFFFFFTIIIIVFFYF